MDLDAAEGKIATEPETPVKTKFLGKLMPVKTVLFLSFYKCIILLCVTDNSYQLVDHIQQKQNLP